MADILPGGIEVHGGDLDPMAVNLVLQVEGRLDRRVEQYALEDLSRGDRPFQVHQVGEELVEVLGVIRAAGVEGLEGARVVFGFTDSIASRSHDPDSAIPGSLFFQPLIAHDFAINQDRTFGSEGEISE